MSYSFFVKTNLPVKSYTGLYFPGIEELAIEMQQDRSKQQERRKIITDKIKEK